MMRSRRIAARWLLRVPDSVSGKEPRVQMEKPSARPTAAHADTRTGRGRPVGAVPGLLLVGLIAGFAFLVRLLPGTAVLSPLIIATFAGIAFRNIAGVPSSAASGIRY